MVNRRHLLAYGAMLAVRPVRVRAEAPLAPLAAYERDTGGHIGLYAQNLGTGKTLAWREHERFVMCSTFKASLAAFVLSRVDRGRDQLTQNIAYGPDDIPDWHAPVARQNVSKGAMSVAEMCEAAVAYSDNTCANLLLARVGGPSALTAFWRSTGDRVTRLDHNEPVLNRSPPGDLHDTTTPRAMAQTLRRLTLDNALSTTSRARLIQWLLDCKTGDNRLRAGLPATWKIGNKTGNNGKDAAGDIAVTWPYSGGPVLISVYTRGGSPTSEQLETTFADVGRLIGKVLV